MNTRFGKDCNLNKRGVKVEEDDMIKRYEECLFIIKNNMSYAISASDVSCKTRRTCTGTGWKKILIFFRYIL